MRTDQEIGGAPEVAAHRHALQRGIHVRREGGHQRRRHSPRPGPARALNAAQHTIVEVRQVRNRVISTGGSMFVTSHSCPYLCFRTVGLEGRATKRLEFGVNRVAGEARGDAYVPTGLLPAEAV